MTSCGNGHNEAGSRSGANACTCASAVQRGPREPQQMSPEIQEIEWIACDWEGGGRKEEGLDEAGYFG